MYIGQHFSKGITMNEELRNLLSGVTADVPDVGRICYGLSRNGSYNAAAKGDIPTIRIGGRLKVPTAVLRRQLGLDQVGAS
ncbi:hypothetical protein V1278_003699 [Bradyrhizobium sp. AZCC 1577]